MFLHIYQGHTAARRGDTVSCRSSAATQPAPGGRIQPRALPGPVLRKPWVRFPGPRCPNSCCSHSPRHHLLWQEAQGRESLGAPGQMEVAEGSSFIHMWVQGALGPGSRANPPFHWPAGHTRLTVLNRTPWELSEDPLRLPFSPCARPASVLNSRENGGDTRCKLAALWAKCLEIQAVMMVREV